MKLFWLIILPALLCTCPENTSAEEESRILPFLLPLITGLLSVTSSIADAISHRSLTPESEATVIGNLISVSSKVTELERQMTVTSDTTIAKILEAFPKIIKLDLKMHELKLIIDQINYADEKMKQYLVLSYSEIESNQTNFTLCDFSHQNSSHDIINNTITSTTTETVTDSNNYSVTESDFEERMDKYILENFSKWVTDHSFNSITSLLKRLNDLIVPENGDGLFNIILEVSKDSQRNLCTLKQSLHQTLYNLYNEIVIAELKGNVVLQISYKLLEMYCKGTFSNEANLALHSYQRYAMQKLETVRKALSTADRTLYNCDPKKYVDGVTHTELTNLQRAYVENQANLNRHHSCYKSCGHYKNTRHYGCHHRNKLCTSQPACKGRILGCHSISSKMQVCLSSNPDRRYDWIKYGRDKILGEGGKVCTKEVFYAKPWLTRLFFRCSYCVCYCDEIGSHSDRYFNLREVTSDIDQNKVVTGLRIVKTNQIIHIQIQQGVLIPHGFINKTSLSWKPVDNYTIHDNNVKNNVDYYTMSLSRRIIDTNEMVGPSEHVITGLRFRITGSHLNLEARATPINFTSGELHKDRSFWLGNYKNDVNQRYGINEVELIKPDVPTRRGPHTLISKFYEYVKFQPTNLEYDVGQSTVPYLDSQILTTHGYPISGIGLIHRGERHSGGFIAPKIISYDFSSCLHWININNAQYVHAAG